MSCSRRNSHPEPRPPSHGSVQYGGECMESLVPVPYQPMYQPVYQQYYHLDHDPSMYTNNKYLITRQIQISNF